MRQGTIESFPPPSFPEPADDRALARLIDQATDAWCRCFNDALAFGTLGHVYLLWAPEPGLFKFGFSRNAERRLKELRGELPFALRMIRYVHGTTQMERAIHDTLRPWRASGEWYHEHSPDVWLAVGAFMRLHQGGKLSARAA